MNRNVSGVFLALALVAAAGCGDKAPAPAPAGGGKAPAPAAGGGNPAPAGGAKYDAAKSTASVKFAVKWTGAKPEPSEVAMTSDCAALHNGAPMNSEKSAMAEDGSLPNTFVTASEGPHKGMTGFPEPAPFVLDQKGCRYIPHVFGVRTGQKFTVKNSDGITHNVHAKPKTQKGFNDSQAANAQNERSFAQKENAIPINCDIHSWMGAVAFSSDHPFFGVTGDDGTATISGLPAGKYKFTVWHESWIAGKASFSTSVEVEVKEGETVSQSVELK